VLVAALLGAVVGGCRRPHGSHLATPALVLPGIGVTGAGLQLSLGILDGRVETQLFAASLALLAGFAVVNRHLVGMGLLAIGLSCNLAAVVVHGGMPVRPSALVEAGVAPPGELADVDLGAGRRFERTDDALPVLGDAIPVRAFGAAMSFGDLVALAGIGVVAADLAQYARRGSRWSLAASLVDLSERVLHRGDRADRSTASGQGLPTEVLVEAGVDAEPLRIVDVRGDVEVLDGARDVVDAQQRVRR
jgi:hypothetical protein